MSKMYDVLCYTAEGERKNIEVEADSAKHAIGVARQKGFTNVRSVAEIGDSPKVELNEPVIQALGDSGPDDSGDQ